jgi:hypothetical protein
MKPPVPILAAYFRRTTFTASAACNLSCSLRDPAIIALASGSELIRMAQKH